MRRRVYGALVLCTAACSALMRARRSYPAWALAAFQFDLGDVGDEQIAPNTTGAGARSRMLTGMARRPPPTPDLVAQADPSDADVEAALAALPAEKLRDEPT